MSAPVKQRRPRTVTVTELVEFAWEYMHAGDFTAAAECFDDAARVARMMQQQLAETEMLERFRGRPN